MIVDEVRHPPISISDPRRVGRGGEYKTKASRSDGNSVVDDCSNNKVRAFRLSKIGETVGRSDERGQTSGRFGGLVPGKAKSREFSHSDVSTSVIEIGFG